MAKSKLERARTKHLVTPRASRHQAKEESNITFTGREVGIMEDLEVRGFNITLNDLAPRIRQRRRDILAGEVRQDMPSFTGVSGRPATGTVDVWGQQDA